MSVMIGIMIFFEFKRWALGNGYDDKLSIDRISNDDDYKPTNCRWVSMKEQANNKRNSVRYNLNGKIIPLTEASEKLGLVYSTLYERNKNKNRKPQLMRLIKYKGEWLTVKELIKVTGFSKSVVNKRLREGIPLNWNVERKRNPYKGKKFFYEIKKVEEVYFRKNENYFKKVNEFSKWNKLD